MTRPLQENKVSGEVTVFYPQMEGKTRVAGMSHANSLVRSQGGKEEKGKMTKEKVQWLNKARLLSFFFFFFLEYSRILLFEEKNSKRVVITINSFRIDLTQLGRNLCDLWDKYRTA